MLVIEDDEPLALLYRTALSLSGFAVQVARDGLTALNLLEHTPPDAAIVDLMLPCLDGWAVLREVAARPEMGGIPILVVSSCEPGPDAAHARAVIRKPCDPEQVVALLRRFLAVPRLAAS